MNNQILFQKSEKKFITTMTNSDNDEQKECDDEENEEQESDDENNEEQESYDEDNEEQEGQGNEGGDEEECFFDTDEGSGINESMVAIEAAAAASSSSSSSVSRIARPTWTTKRPSRKSSGESLEGNAEVLPSPKKVRV